MLLPLDATSAPFACHLTSGFPTVRACCGSAELVVAAACKPAADEPSQPGLSLMTGPGRSAEDRHVRGQLQLIHPRSRRDTVAQRAHDQVPRSAQSLEGQGEAIACQEHAMARCALAQLAVRHRGSSIDLMARLYTS